MPGVHWIPTRRGGFNHDPNFNGSIDMKGLLVGFISGLLVLPLLGFLYLRLGYAPVATSAPPLPLERYIAQTALHIRIDKEMPKSLPSAPTEASFLAGARTYREQCAVCHGLPGQPQSAIAKGMFPPPPHLFEGHGVTDDPTGETYWKVRNGIRLTGMPGFQKSLSDEQIWQVSEFLARADKVPASVLKELTETQPGKK
jgi:mono/diheme cytochrome c family protein